MNRRDTVVALLALGATPLVARAQQAGRMYRIGSISPCTGLLLGPSAANLALRQGLQDRGYVEGQNLTLEWRCFQRIEQTPEIIGQFLERKVDIIVAFSGPGTEAAKNASGTVPVVFIDHSDPVGTGIVASLARPGGNATGISSMGAEMTAKRLQLLKEVVPRAMRVVVLANPTSPTTPGQLRGLDDAGRTLGVTLRVLKISTPAEIDAAFSALIKERPDAVLVLADTMFFTERVRIADQAARARVPAMYPQTNYAVDGGLLAYFPDLTDMSRHAVGYVDKILKGAKPGDLPVEQPTKFELVINLKTAKALGLTIPPTILLRADRVIE